MSLADAAGQVAAPASIWPLVLPFIVNYAVVVAALGATWAVTRQVRAYVGSQMPVDDERWKQVPAAVRPPAIDDLISWAVDAVASLTCIVAPLAGFIVLFAMSPSWPVLLAYAFAGLVNFAVFLWVLLGTTPSEYVMKPSQHLPSIVTVVPIVAFASTTIGLGVTLAAHAVGWLD